MVCEVCDTKSEALRERAAYGEHAKVYLMPANSVSESDWRRVR